MPMRAHAVVDATGAEARLRDREAAALLAEQVVGRDADVVVIDLAVAAACRRSRTPAASRTIVTPGVSIGTSTIDCCRY